MEPLTTMLGTGFALGGFVLGSWVAQMEQRTRLYEIARRYAWDRGKKLLVVGRPKGRHGGGGVCIDLSPDAHSTYGDVEYLSAYEENHFGAAFVSHVLEHVENPFLAMKELQRVAEAVFVAYPDSTSLIAWFHPGHRWVLIDVPQGEAGHAALRTIRNPFTRLLP